MNLVKNHTKGASKWLFILTLATCLRFYHLDGQSLWSDEGNSVALARRGFMEIAQRTAFDIHPPLYYWLLKIWLTIFGDSEMALRSLSAILGVGLVGLSGWLGQRLFSLRVGLIAAFLAVFAPLQIYYAQEARMYMLLAFLCTATVSLAWELRTAPTARLWGIAYIATVTAGLYTHYAYPLILGVIGLTIVGQASCLFKKDRQDACSTMRFIIYTLIAWLFYLPWIPTAWRQLTTWPSEKQAVPLLTILKTVANTLLFGLTWPIDLGIMPMVGLGLLILLTVLMIIWQTLPTNFALKLLLWWLILPSGLTCLIYSPAFLKFLIVATIPLTLLLAVTLEKFTRPLTPASRPLILFFLTATSMFSLYHYYTNPSYARDNYRGIVAFIKAVGQPTDGIILNAEGQQDVFNYYYYPLGFSNPKGLYPLPRHRPLDKAATVTELQQIVANSPKIYAVYWASPQADPRGLIENWLNRHLFKATDQWYGNVRLVSYARPLTVGLTITPTNSRLGEHIRLVGYGVGEQEIAAGDILQLALVWQTDAPLNNNYVVFGQLLDGANHVVAQRDAAPLLPTSLWPTDKVITDTHGLFIEPGTPPGLHRLIVGLYDSQTGQRLAGSTQDFIDLGQVKVGRAAVPLPRQAFQMQIKSDMPLGQVTLLGYDLYKLGHRSRPDTPLYSGDPLHLVAYWQMSEVFKTVEFLEIRVVGLNGQTTPVAITAPLAGVDYPVKSWQQEIVRAQYDLFLSGLAPGFYRLALRLDSTNTFLTKPFLVE